jgi:hypothetical protein
VGKFPDPIHDPEPYRQIIGSSQARNDLLGPEKEVAVMSTLITNPDLITNPHTQTDAKEQGGCVPGPPAAEQFLAEAERVHRLAAEQLVLTQSRCVDHLLDLRNLATEPVVRAVLEGGLAAIRKLSSVESTALQRTIGLAVAAAFVESSYEELVLEPFPDAGQA